MSWLLALLFAVTALCYASVGFGGGSTYNALLALSGADYRVLPAIALVCNIIVVSGGVWRFSAERALPVRRLLPYLVASAPAAWIGGRIAVSETVFVGLLGLCLALAGVRMALQKEVSADLKTAGSSGLDTPLALGVGAGVGFVAGLVGIGGGIFLAPALYAMRWGNPREIAGACSLFILVNSVFGLGGQFVKLGELDLLASALPYWPLIPAVLVGGQLGSRLGSVGLAPAVIKRLTAALILYVSCRLLYRWSELTGLLG